jgi:hypothetical protein
MLIVVEPDANSVDRGDRRHRLPISLASSQAR